MSSRRKSKRSLTAGPPTEKFAVRYTLAHLRGIEPGQEDRQSCLTIESPGPSVICQPVSFCGIDWHLVLQVRLHHINSMDGLNEVDFHQVRDGKSLDQAVEGG